ncbi:MAG: hypothetical protein Q9160_008746 [Pyrenula sp. 1 TL-2023]
METINDDQLRSLEQLRGRLYQLSQAFNTLHADLDSGELSPESISLQIQTTLTLKSLQTVCESLSKHAALLAPLVAYPLPLFPGRYHEAKLQTMLRTRLETRVEDWVSHGKELAEPPSTGNTHRLNTEDLKELWNWAAPQANEMAQEQIFFHNYTAAEKEGGVENVITGLTTQPVDDTEEDEEDDDDDEDEEGDEEDDGDRMDTSEEGRRKSGGKPAGLAAGATAQAQTLPAMMPMEKMLRFMTTGAMPG